MVWKPRHKDNQVRWTRIEMRTFNILSPLITYRDGYVLHSYPWSSITLSLYTLTITHNFHLYPDIYILQSKYIITSNCGLITSHLKMFESIHNQYNFVGGEEEADWKRWLLLFLSLTSEVTQYSGFLVSKVSTVQWIWILAHWAYLPLWAPKHYKWEL